LLLCILKSHTKVRNLLMKKNLSLIICRRE
jgi:hypothetical protein